MLSDDLSKLQKTHLKPQSAVESQEYPKSFDEFRRTINTLNNVVKIQSHFKRNSACIRVQKLAQQQIDKIQRRQQAQKQNPEQAVMQEFVTQLRAKHLTPEAFYRICDPAYARRITKETFRAALKHFNLRLTDTQCNRLEYILNENGDDDDPHITYEEYQQALEAYDLCGEKHFVGQGPNGKGYVKHETLVLERLHDILESRDMDPSELYNACDEDRSGQLSLQELRKMIRTLKASINEKDLQGIEKFFALMDKDGSGSISKAEFLTHFQRGTEIAQTKKAEDARRRQAAQDAGVDEFAEAAIEQADQGMFSDAFDAVKGFFTGKKEKFANLDATIPGYTLMSPKSKCDSAVSALIKEMTRHQIKAATVFAMADTGNKGKSTVKKLRSAFTKVAPKIDALLIADALKSFGSDSTEVDESSFKTLINAQFDAQVNATVPNSKNVPAATSPAKKARPATASSVVKPDPNACQSLIRKLDNALLRQKLSPFDAFHAADLNKNGMITVDELKLVLKKMLPDHALTPADLKMTMVAFDTNRNGSIDENEFIKAITEARDNSAPVPNIQISNQPSEPRLSTMSPEFNQSQKKPFAMDNTISSIGAADQNSEEYVTKLVAQYILRALLIGGCEGILGDYWGKTDGQMSSTSRAEELFLENWEGKPSEGKIVFEALSNNYEEEVQKVLDRIFHACRLPKSTCTKKTLQWVAEQFDENVDNLGMAAVYDCKAWFSQAIPDSKRQELYNKFKTVYEEFVGQCKEPDSQIQKLFNEPLFLKTFFLSAQTLREEQKQEVNALSLATGMFLNSSETLYGRMDSETEELWKTIVFKYLAKLYDGMDETRSAEDQHKKLLVHAKMLKKVSIRKWIGFLDSNRLKQVNPQNYKCLYAARQIRTVLPPFMDEMMPLNDCLAQIEEGIAPYRAAKPATSAPKRPVSAKPAKPILKNSSPAKNNSSFADTSQEIVESVAPAKAQQNSKGARKHAFRSNRENPILVEVENTIGTKLEEPLMEILKEREVATGQEISKTLYAVNKAVSKELMLKLFNACGGLKNKQLAMTSLMGLLLEESEEHELVQETLKALSSKIKDPVRSFMQREFPGGWDGGIDKQTFFELMDQLGVQASDWGKICLFYSLDVDDTADERVQFETIVKLVTATKGGKYDKPGSAAAAATTKPAAAAKGVKFDHMGDDGLSKIVRKTGEAVKRHAIEWLNDFKEQQKIILDGQAFETMEAPVKPQTLQEEQTGVEIEDFEVNHNIVMKVIKGYFKIQKLILDPKRVMKTYKKLQHWFDSFEGNDEEGAHAYFNNEIVKVMSRPANAHLTEPNVLMLRYVFFTIKDKNGDRLFDMFELIILMMSLIERDGFYQLEVDNDFTNILFHLADSDDDELSYVVAQAINRLEVNVHLATLIMREEQRRLEQGQPFNITDDQTWTDCRFSRITIMMCDALKDRKMKKAFLDVFNNADKQSLTYYEFCSLFRITLGCTQVSEWMFEDFQSQLDRMGLACIELTEVAEWLLKYGCDLGIKASKQDQTDVMNKKLQIGPKDYQIDPSKDYYRGIPTILNSEVAALAKVIEIANTIGEGDKFFDKDFGPQSEDDLEGKAKSMYFGGVKPQSHPDPENVDFLRPSEYLDEGLHAKFVKGDASANEVKQGALGDCWFIGALSVLATRDELLRGKADSVPPELANLIDSETAMVLSMGVYPPIFHRYRHLSMYVLRFFKDSNWRYVIIDDRLPCYKGNKQLVFGKCSSADELWVPLVEKAYAKLHGCYQTLISGFIDDGLADLTAMVCEKRQIHNRRGEFDQDKEEFWEYLNNMKEYGCLMGCSVTGGTEHGIRIDGVDTGIMSGHAYSLNDIFTIDDEEMDNPRKSHRILRIRNPWGRGEWKGKWSDDSEEIDKFENKLQAYIDELEKDEQFELGANDGTFLINYASFRDIYNRLFVVNDFPSEWSAVRFNSEWTTKCSGGLPIEKTEAANKRFATNPQFVFVSDEDCQLFCSLQQSDGREQGTDGSYSKYPFKDRIVSAMLFLFELPEGQDRLLAYDNPMEKATPKVLHEMSMRVNLKAGKKYVIVPSARKAGTVGKFHLSLYVNKAQYEFDVKRVDDPTNRYTFIKEEYEKMDRRVPKWKVQWCQENLKYMIGKDDMEQSFSTSVTKAKRSKTLAKSKTLKKKKTVKSGKLSALAASLKTDVVDEQEDEEEDCNLE